MPTIEWLIEIAKGRERREFTVTADSTNAATSAAKRRAPGGWHVVRVVSKRQLGIGRSTGRR